MNAQMKVPPIADFAREIDWTLSDFGLDRIDFDDAVAEHAKENLCEWLQNINESRLQHYTGLTNETCERLGILHDQHFGPLSAYLWKYDHELRIEFAHDSLKYIAAQLHPKRLKDAREWNRNLGEY